MDYGTIIGIIIGAILFLLGALLGCSVGVYIDVPSLLVVVGGLGIALLMNYSLRDVKKVLPVIANAVLTRECPASSLVGRFVGYAEQVRKEGVLSLKREIPRARDLFVRTGLHLATESARASLLRGKLDVEWIRLDRLYRIAEDMCQRLAIIAGLVGAAGMLIAVIVDVNGSNTVSPSMVVSAVMPLLYGLCLAALVLYPVAGKIRNRFCSQQFIHQIVIEAIVSIRSGDDPASVQKKLKSFLSSCVQTSSHS